MTITAKQRADQERTLNRRNQVLDAAAGCFRRSGFHGASMAEISKAAGMSAGHIYNYFASKDAIITAFVEKNLERVAAILLDLRQQEDPLQTMLDNAEHQVKENLDPEMWGLQLEIFSEASRNPTIATALRDADTRLRGELHSIMQRARLQRGLAADDATVAGRLEALIGLYQGISLRALHHPDMDQTSVIAAFRLALAPLLFS
ncbi:MULTISPECIES: TetR/AcrR family transcriptional regulator [unclassified Janthinobacterium]|uniref:TetR/AcrR family transcriptional regulator n=1 Tax=unclassified Janthinobacterium TaxID=2610881 RepID=UPI00034C029D|nr:MULTISPECIES: TetR/AcrR family transcriptional regulator [unclassified Janthinobacterium]MEC5159567.1 AcrR family transcriptional regulator [Janthinobacterium sp. CG_S6]